MSRAFVKETSESAPPPERMVDDGPNLVTPDGLAQIEGHVARIEDALKSQSNPLLRETLARDLRYWVHQRSTAEVVTRPLRPAAPDTSPVNGGGTNGAGEEHTVAFGSSVTVSRKGREQSFRIVGVDEAEPSRGLISFRSPLAAAILGSGEGDTVESPLGEIAILKVQN
jgi:hypothetical protein